MKTEGKVILLFIFLLFNRVCSGQDKNRKTALEDKVIDKIAMLPEVIRADAYCKKKSKGKRHLVTFVSANPDKEGNYYLVKVAEDNGSAFHAWYLFAVYPGTYKVEFFDSVNGKYVPLQVWRKHYRHY